MFVNPLTFSEDLQFYQIFRTQLNKSDLAEQLVCLESVSQIFVLLFNCPLFL